MSHLCRVKRRGDTNNLPEDDPLILSMNTTTTHSTTTTTTTTTNTYSYKGLNTIQLLQILLNSTIVVLCRVVPCRECDDDEDK